ncbi:MAG: class I SAM-dependent methyltransferase [Desulfuromonadales bacterium]
MTQRLTLYRQIALFPVSAALLAFQIALLQILATSQWHHFAYLVISIALLGFGVAGTALALARGWILARASLLLPLLLCACAVTLAGSLSFIESLFGSFDSYLLFVNPGEALRLAVSALTLMLPFTCGALAIGIIFTSGAEQIGSHYFANMLGSGIGCALGLAGLANLPATLLPPLCGLLALLSAVALLPGSKRSVRGCVLLSLAGVTLFLFVRPGITLSQYKDLRKTLDLPGAEIIVEEPSTFGQLHIVTAPVLRSATALSLLWLGEMPSSPAVFINGDMLGSIPSVIGRKNPMNATTSALPFALASPERILVLNAGTAQHVALALGHGAEEIVAVESHRVLLRELFKLASEQNASVFTSERVTWHSEASRTWLARDTTRYDLIMLPDIGSSGGNAGLFALHEQPLLTKQALQQAWQKLTPGGYLSVTTWIDYPARSPLRLLATLVELLEETGAEPTEHIAALRSWGTLTFCIKKTPLDSDEIAAARNFAERWAFDTALLTGIADAKRDYYNQLQDTSLLELIDATLLKERRQALYRDYPFRIVPTSDDRPFFSQFLRWSRIDLLLEQFGQRTVPFIELGVLVAGLAALILTVLAVILVLLPLVRLSGEPGSRFRTLLFFGGLGVGYMWVELAMIHRFEFYIGQPVYSAALVVAVLLIGSALGSMLTEQFSNEKPQRFTTLAFIVLTTYVLTLGPILQSTIHFSLFSRVALAIAVLIPAALIMGMPFPLGIRLLNRTSRNEIPWAWGINGCLSVVGAAFATLIAVETGYSILLLLAAGAYFLASLFGLRCTVKDDG